MSNEGEAVRFTIDEYAKKFKMSNEMVQTKIKSKRLNTILEDGVIYIVVPKSTMIADEQSANDPVTPASSQPPAKRTTVAAVIALYQKENAQLKKRIAKLEEKIDSLIADKERMLIAERDKIESIYIKKDDQLKSILEVINKQLQLTYQQQKESPTEVQQTEVINDAEDIEPMHEEEPLTNEHFISLRNYLKTLDLKSSQKKFIKRRFADAYGSDVRIIQQNGAFFLDFTRFDYSDLFAL